MTFTIDRKGDNYMSEAISAWFDKNGNVVTLLALGLWFLFYIIQAFLAFGTAYRCTKAGADSGAALFVYLIGFGFAALIPGLGLHYYIKNLAPKIQVVKQTVQPQVVKIVEQAPPQQVYRQSYAGQCYNAQYSAQQYTPEQIAAMQQYQAQYQQTPQSQQPQQTLQSEANNDATSNRKKFQQQKGQ